MALLQTNYLSKNSFIHSLSPVVKLLWILIVVFLFLSSSSMTLFIIIDLVVIVLAFIAKVGVNFVKGVSVMIGSIFFFSLIIHGFFNPLGTGSNEVIFLTVTLGGLMNGLFFGFKITALISIFYLFILSTYPGRIVTSLRRFGLPYKAGYLINSTLQIIPIMLMDADTILDAQKARGLETKGRVWTRLKAYIPLIGPLVLGSVTRVYEKTIALEVRGFSSMKNKSSFYIERVRTVDKILTYVSLALLVLVILSRVIGWVL